MELKLKRLEERGEVEEFDGRNTAYVVGAILLAATFWASPSMGILFAIALIVCAAVCAFVLLLAGAIGFCDSAASRIWSRERAVKMPSRAMSA